MSKRVCALQPTLYPWLGYFELIKNSDLYVVYDDVQFSKSSWQQRNRIKRGDEVLMLTVPVKHKSRQPIKDVEIDNSQPWQRKHWKTIQNSYRHAPYFKAYDWFLQDIYSSEWRCLCDLNMHIIKGMMALLHIKTPVRTSSEIDYHRDDNKTQRLVNLLKAMEATELYEPSGGRDYIQEELFEKAGITLTYQNYVPKEYRQSGHDFIPRLGCLDLLLNEGMESNKYVDGEGG